MRHVRLFVLPPFRRSVACCFCFLFRVAVKLFTFCWLRQFLHCHSAGGLPVIKRAVCPRLVLEIARVYMRMRKYLYVHIHMYVYIVGPGECHKTCDAIAQPQMFAQFTIAVADGGGNQQLLHVAPNWPGSSVCSPKIEHNLHSARELITIGSWLSPDSESYDDVAGRWQPTDTSLTAQIIYVGAKKKQTNWIYIADWSAGRGADTPGEPNLATLRMSNAGAPIPKWLAKTQRRRQMKQQNSAAAAAD